MKFAMFLMWVFLLEVLALIALHVVIAITEHDWWCVVSNTVLLYVVGRWEYGQWKHRNDYIDANHASE